ncbi:16S rRNA (cytosine(1402)-N(4))-methyltransferase RsmH [Candidatus Pelagibacter bacterium]|nr:16S rRNA (cytosine(1402)-N(4))-methyltransferase RsmH [Candidatus Pelagibacter bacterium]
MNSQKPSLEFSHFPVMLSEIIEISNPNKGGLFVDCTFGGGGYSQALLEFPKTKILAIDRDPHVISIANKLKKKFKNRFKFFQLRFSQMDEVLKEDADTIIIDLGLSSIQLNNLDRGFSFKSKKKLDMTMGLTEKSAQDVINNLPESELMLIIKILGEEKDAKKIARNIAKARIKKKITKVNELVEIIERSKKRNYSTKINPSTKTFQALRIFVNKEITELINGIIKASKLLRPGGKILIVSFHSIEDKIIKYFFKNFSKNRSKPSRYLPDANTDNYSLFEKYSNKVLKPSQDEIKENNSSRSAKLRYAIRSDKKFIFPNDLIKKFNKYLDIEAINV